MSTICGLEGLIRQFKNAQATSLGLQIAGTSESFAELAITRLFHDILQGSLAPFKKIVVVLPSPKDFNTWSQTLEVNIGPLAKPELPIGILPFFSLWGRDRLINPSLSRHQRIYALSLLSSPERSGVILTTLAGLAQKTLTLKAFRDNSITVRKGMTLGLDEFIAHLRDLNFHKTSTVEEECSFAVRGGLIDIFPCNHLTPLRIDFIGDEVASIRRFSLVDQKSTSSLEEAVIAPATEIPIPDAGRKDYAQRLYNTLLELNAAQADRDGIMDAFEGGVRFSGFDLFSPSLRIESETAFDYFEDRTLLFFPKTIASCLDSFSTLLQDLSNAHKLDVGAARPTMAPELHYADLDSIAACTSMGPGVLEFGNPFSSPKADFATWQTDPTISLSRHIPSAPLHQDADQNLPDLFQKWCDLIKGTTEKLEGSVAILTHHDEQQNRVQNLLTHHNLISTPVPDLISKICRNQMESGKIYVGHGDLSSHFWLEERRLLVIPEQALFGAVRRKPKPASVKLQNYLSSFKDLKANDLVVHVEHGIGRYSGMTSLSVGGLEYDFLILEYAGGDKIYLPVDRLNLLQRYGSGKTGDDEDDTGKTRRHAHPALDKLGSGQWEKRKTKVRKAVHDMADELLKIQARRELADGTAISPPGESYYKFEAEFPYEETEDQLRALSEVNFDLTSKKPMDRLICGDVGFGKTEVALRAAYRAVLDGYQALVLVPTTVLCYQHYRTFSERLSKHGVSVAYANRFVDGSTIKKTVADLEKGHVDILIGTHRILSQDIKPKRLGLLVIDEEQRFGVAHKERLKKLRVGTDILTLTATPIPRTLHMSMLGLRDISIIATPPHDRLSVKTYISKFDEALIQDALRLELSRGGQAFFVHNRVDEIAQIAAFIQKLVPETTVRFAHGRLPEHQLESVIVDFLEQKFPILVCTTIIESGVDMPNVNTIIINRAERFGLAQLYQLRGRVGRSSVQAYAYLMTSPNESLSDEASRRLEVIVAHQELGSGFQIASHDLELRGAGNLLGAEQSGHIASVGFEMYTDMLQDAIHDIRGEVVEEVTDTEIKIPISAVISPSYIQSEGTRLHIYKRLFSADIRDTSDEIGSLKKEVEDRFGEMPPECGRLFRVASLKQKLRFCKATALNATEKGIIEVKFGSLNEKQIDIIIGLGKDHPDRYRLSPDYKLFILIKVKKKPSAEEQDDMLSRLSALVDPIVQSFELLEQGH